MKTQKQLAYFLIILAVALALLIAWLVYYRQHYAEDFFSYHGFDFKRVNNGYELSLYINSKTTPNTITLRSDPRKLEDIPLDPGILSLSKKNEIYAMINPYDNLTGVTTIAVLEIDKIFDNPFLYNIPVNASFTEPYGNTTLPVKNCQEKNTNVGLLWFKIENETHIYPYENCFIVAGEQEEDLIRAADRIIYTILGVMKL